MEIEFDPEMHGDNPPMDAAFMAGMKPSRRGRPKSEAPKVEVKIRLDAKTVEHLRGSGPGWQTRVNALLGKLVETGQI
ncbi:BrnA antitoxin family protein [Sphingomonas sp. H39-1-10]|uniref:BrnA antitoxin family protein n=1 Tax=Sphingomonas pollutisoli TaxID=3030829 RepID=UPI0023B9E781|nr:BrnA antitoxin family protein [Sphingomonas pollutisoli]MDF0491404.1 BrnA antitoxin family protein [Sphingomonas pollutisoli]